jgi:Leucine-rich repeat (LRR) protein
MSPNRHFPTGSDEGLAEAKKLVTNAARSGAHSLDLSGLGLTNLPEEIFTSKKYNFENLHSLILRFNKLTEIPIEFNSFPNLINIDISSNQLSDFPNTIPQFVKLKRLLCNHNQFEVLPEMIGQLNLLEELDLHWNKLIALPESIGQLSNLKTLKVGYSQLTALPGTIGQLSNLKLLMVGYNRLATLPETIGHLTALGTLDIERNQLTTLPKAIGGLLNLKSLKVGENRLTMLPETIGSLIHLQTLWLNNNQLAALPEPIGQLTSLAWLRLDRNLLTALPETIGRLSNLETLNLTHNQLTTLPETIGELSELSSLWLSHNRLTCLPKTIVKLSKVSEFYINGNPLLPNIEQALDNGGLRALAATIDKASSSAAPQPFVRPFPKPEAVFAAPVERYARHLHPLVSIDLAVVDPALSGWIHLVSPIEPCDGYLGDSGREHWGPYLQPNWIGFRLTSEHRYELLGDFRFFGVENTGGEESYSGAVEELQEFYEEMHASFAEHKAAYLENGQVCRIRKSGSPRRVAVLSNLGGEAPMANMTWSKVPGAAFSYSDTDRAPRTADGRLYKFIAAVPGRNYRSSGADLILLFYDPVERIALQTFVFT